MNFIILEKYFSVQCRCQIMYFILHPQCGIVLCGVAIISSSWLTKKSCELLLKSGQIARRRNYEGLGKLLQLGEKFVWLRMVIKQDLLVFEQQVHVLVLTVFQCKKGGENDITNQNISTLFFFEMIIIANISRAKQNF